MHYPVAAALNRFTALIQWTRKLLLGGMLMIAAAVLPSSLAAQRDAPSSRWQRIYSDADLSIWIDTQTARTEGDSILRVWTEWRYEQVQVIDETGERYDSVKTQDEIDCESRQYRNLRWMFSFRGGSLGVNEASTLRWREPVPESMAESLVDGVCFWAGR